MSHITDLSHTQTQLDALLEQGMADYRAHNYTEALSAFEAGLNLSPNASDVLVHLGNCYLQLGQLDLAQRQFEQAITVDPMEGNAYLNIGKLFFKRGQYRLATYYWEQAKTLVKNSPNLWLNLGIAYDKLQQPDRALKCYSIFIGLQPSSMEAAKLQVRFDKARKVYENNILIAEDLLKNGQLSQAKEIFHKELLQYPATAKVHRTFASLLYQNNELEAALQQYLMAYNIRKNDASPLDATVMINLGVTFERLKQPIDALWAYHLTISNQLPQHEKIIPHYNRLIGTLKQEAGLLVPDYLQQTRDKFSSFAQVDTGREMTERLEEIKSLLPAELQADIDDVCQLAIEALTPSAKAAKTYFNMGEDARKQGKFDHALQFYHKFLLLQNKGEKVNQVRQHIQEIKQVMGAVVTSMLQIQDLQPPNLPKRPVGVS